MRGIFVNDWFALVRSVIVSGLAYQPDRIPADVREADVLEDGRSLVVTVALGSTLASLLLSADVAPLQGATALGPLILLQFAITWSSVRWRWVRGAITAEPSLPFHRGQYLHAALQRARVKQDEGRALIRGMGHSTYDDVEAVVLEN